jgi:hypothetical protein
MPRFLSLLGGESFLSGSLRSRASLKTRWIFGLFLLCGVFCTGGPLLAQSSGKTLYVAVKQAEIKDGTGFFAKSAGFLTRGEAVSVIQAEGKWVKIRTTPGDRSGWIAAASLTAKQVLKSERGVTADELALAGKGFSADIETRYKKNGLDYSTVDSLEALNIPNSELLKFITDGHLFTGD